MACFHFSVAQVYARAVFDLAQKDENEEEWADFLDVLAKSVSEIKSYILNPVITNAQRVQILSQALSCSEKQAAFISVVVRHHRLSILFLISQSFYELLLQSQKTTLVSVTTPYSLTDQDKEQLSLFITGTSSPFPIEANNTVIFQETHDPLLIGGVILSVGDNVLDCSVDGQLARFLSAIRSDV